MTLVELLVVISIMVMLVAVSVPTFKPMLESQRSAGGARAVAMTLQRARTKAIQEKRPYGIEFVRFHEGNTPNLSLQMKLQKEGYRFVQISSDIRVRVVGGTIRFYQYNSGWNSIATPSDWNDKVQGGYLVQFGRVGRFYRLSDNGNVTLDSPYGSLDLPDSNAPLQDAVEFTVLQPPRSTLTPPVVLPRGTVIDLQFSGFRNPDMASGSNDVRYHSFSSFQSGALGTTLMFSPSGNVNKCFYYGTNNQYVELKPYGGLFYFLVGEWERQGTNDQGENLAEDGRNNLITPSNFWVTVNPRTGQVRVTENGPVSQTDVTNWKNETDAAQKTRRLRELMIPARKFATEHYTDIGGF